MQRKAKTNEYRDIPTLWVGVRNGRKAFEILWESDGLNWFIAGKLACHKYATNEWRLLLHGRSLGTHAYSTFQDAMRAAQRFKAIRERMAR